MELSDADKLTNVIEFVKKHLPMTVGAAILCAMNGDDPKKLDQMLKEMKPFKEDK